ncbi:MAG: response regulator [Deltaproteobacteria bacterium]|jgi:CheY-like chemotaxis protein|nr:response regulator [Deltaproteobacteria bacterium]
MSEALVPGTEEYVVVAEDSPPNRTILVLLLKKLGYKVLECEDGEIAWSTMQKNKDKNIVAVISDMMMPNMDGMELLRRIRGTAGLEKLPFVFVTAISEKDYIFEAKNLKANGYILKPVTYSRVTQKLKELFPQKSFPNVAA